MGKTQLILSLLMLLSSFALAVYGPGSGSSTSTPTSTPMPIIQSAASPSDTASSTQNPSALGGIIDVSSIPSGALVYSVQNGVEKYRGTTPIQFTADGLVTVSIFAKGYLQYSAVMKGTVGKTVNIVAQLEPIPSIIPTVPAPTSSSPDYSCELPTLKERVKCRLDLPENSQTAKLAFIPEECRSQIDEKSKTDCIHLYEKLSICNRLDTDANREKCAKNELALGSSIAIEKSNCDALKENDRLDCISSLRSKLYSLIKFRFYNLEEHAEKLMEKGANEALVVDFISQLETKKAEFNRASGLSAKKQVIWEVRSIWEEFKKSAKAQIENAK
ncbi:hypothetical protein HY989_02715 [Candidatus Micrarchaeota archaeon]|nr:hypothetical protein [Candidatus Micrarchaeota archaeon]